MKLKKESAAILISLVLPILCLPHLSAEPDALESLAASLAPAIHLIRTARFKSAAAERCAPHSLIQFISHGKPVASETISSAGSCKDFGGNLVYTPKHHLYLFVNFDIRGTIDLDEIDSAVDQHAGPKARRWILGQANPDMKFGIAVVKDAWMDRMYPERDYPLGHMNLLGDGFYITERAISQNQLAELLRTWLSDSKMWDTRLPDPPPETNRGKIIWTSR